MNDDIQEVGFAEQEKSNTRDNAKQALIELVGMLGVRSDKKNHDTDAKSDPDGFEVACEGDSSPQNKKGAVPVCHTPLSYEHTSFPTVIAKNTSITGNIQAAGDVEVRGELKGDISSGGSVTVSGTMLGGLTAKKDVCLISSNIQGNISTEEDVTIDKDSAVIGDIHARNITCDGHVKGTLLIDGLATLACNALLLCDISASRIVVNEGARIVGAIKINQEMVSEAAFEDVQM